jgi:crotonobetainyl-CoA:carnitine CoA-transferase CaiB-like acyl-CoA transferase
MFEKLKVLELASVLAGPAVGTFFAELGAEVIKIENKSSGGDMTREWKLSSEDHQSRISAYFSSINYGKTYLSKDLSKKEDQEEVHQLIRSADIVIANFKNQSAEKLRMDHKTLSALNPRLIYGSIEGFSSDPDKVAFDMVLQAETGFMSMNGFPDRDPAKLPVAFIDLFAAHQLKEGILIALLKRKEDDRGSWVKVSLEEAALASLANQASNFLMEGMVPKRLGSLHPNIAPYGEIISTKEGKKFVLAVGTDKQFKELCHVLGCTHLLDEDHFKINADRVIYREDLKFKMDPFFEKINADDLMDACKNKKIPIGEIKDLKQVLESPIAQQMILKERIEEIETSRLRSIAFQIIRNKN